MKNALHMQSVIGDLSIIEEDEKIIEVTFGRMEASDIQEKRTPLLQEACTQLEAYFSGKRKEFDLPLQPRGTIFQKSVWEALCTIPYGETRSYKDIAQQIGNPKACRAIGMANHNNPIAIIIPCHRVIGAGGSLTGYAGGLDIKQQLLNLESTTE